MPEPVSFPLNAIPKTESLTRDAILVQLFSHYGVHEKGEENEGVEQYRTGTEFPEEKKDPMWCSLFNNWAMHQVTDYAGSQPLLPENTREEINGAPVFQNSQNLRKALHGNPALSWGKENSYIPQAADIFILQRQDEGKEHAGHVCSVVSATPHSDGTLRLLTIDGNSSRIKGRDAVSLEEWTFNPRTGEALRHKINKAYNAGFVNIEALPNYAATEAGLKEKPAFAPVPPLGEQDKSAFKEAVALLKGIPIRLASDTGTPALPASAQGMKKREQNPVQQP